MCLNYNLSLIAKEHKKWIKIVMSLGEINFAEDIVQDVYIKIHKNKYDSRIVAKGIVSTSYMYLILRDTVFTYYRKQKKTIIESIDNQKEITTQSFNNDKENAYLAICEKIDKEIDSWHWYDKELFKIYRMHWRDTKTLNRMLDDFNGKVSIRKIAKNTNISLTTLFHELKESKIKIKEKFKEDWLDYKNEEYHLITNNKQQT